MKAKELRIGNLIKIASFSKEPISNEDKIAKDYGYNIFIVNGAILKDAEGKDYAWKPIPLTEEWLVKFGFKSCMGDPEATGTDIETGQYNVIKEDDLGFSLEIMFGFRNDGSVLVHLNDVEFLNCHYVHQLQNLYFALTGEELTIL